jgi:hypothetical protein
LFLLIGSRPRRRHPRTRAGSVRRRRLSPLFLRRFQYSHAAISPFARASGPILKSRAAAQTTPETHAQTTKTGRGQPRRFARPRYTCLWLYRAGTPPR